MVAQKKSAGSFYPKVSGLDPLIFYGVILVPFYIYYEFIAKTVKPDLYRVLAINGAFIVQTIGEELLDDSLKVGKSTRIAAIF